MLSKQRMTGDWGLRREGVAHRFSSCRARAGGLPPSLPASSQGPRRPAAIGRVNFPQGAELLVLTGGFADEHGDYAAGSWLRIPAGGSIAPRSGELCELYIKEGGFAYLREDGG